MDVPGLIALSSAIPLIILGILLLSVRPLRPSPTFFALFAILWGTSLTISNLGRVVDLANVKDLALPLSLAFWPPASLFLIQHVRLGRGPGPHLAALLITLALGTLALGALILDPQLVTTVIDTPMGPVTTFGPAVVPFFIVPFYSALNYALWATALRHRRAEPGTQRYALRGQLMAFAVFTTYTNIRLLTIYLDPPASIARFGVLQQGLLVATFAAGTALAIGITLRLALRPPAPDRIDPALLASFAVPAFVALLESILARQGLGFDIDSVGIWRLLMVAILVRALTRDRLFDLDLRLKTIAAPTLAGLAFGLGTAYSTVLLASGSRTTTTILPFIVGLATAAAIIWRRHRVGELLFRGVTTSPAYLRQRAREVYVTHLENVLVQGRPVHANDLASIRGALGLRDEDHHALLRLAHRNAELVTLPAATTTAPQPTHTPTTPPPADQTAETNRPLRPNDTISDRYRVDRLLGQGSHGRAFLAYDKTQAQDVVIKAVATSHLGGRAVETLRHEADLLQDLQHGHVIRIHDIVETPHELLLVMDHAAGGNLQGQLERRGRIPPKEARRLIRETLLGLQAAHDANITHRDIKPENVLLTHDGHVQLADFGIARRDDPETTATNNRTEVAGAIGTLLYMSPEQVRGQPLDLRSDLYAVATMAHILLTGRHPLPITGRDDYQIRKTIVEAAPDLDTRNLPPWAQRTLTVALAKNPDNRYANAAEMLESIDTDA